MPASASPLEGRHHLSFSSCDTDFVTRVLIAEDEQDLNELIAQELERDGHEVIRVFDGAAALAAVERDHLDLAILDWMMPKLDGLSVCRRIREQHILPVLVLTARGEESDVVLGLEVGADDYMTKPFRMAELRARVRAILRRSELTREVAGQSLRAGPLRVEPEQRAAFAGRTDLDLTPREFELLQLFVQNPGRAFSREYLLDRLWADDYDVTDRTVDTHVQRLRKKLGGHAGLIKTVWGLGYKLQLPDP